MSYGPSKSALAYPKPVSSTFLQSEGQHIGLDGVVEAQGDCTVPTVIGGMICLFAKSALG